MKICKKLKSKKKIFDNRSTINEIHDTKMEEFEKYYKTLPSKEEELIKLREEYETLSDYDKFDFKFKIKDLEKEIYHMKEKTEMTNYLLNVSPVFYKMKQTDYKEEKPISNNLKTKIKEGIEKYITITEGSQKGTMLEEFMCAMDRNIIKKVKENDNEIFICKDCGSNCIFNSKECFVTCTKCGLCREWQDPDTPQWSDEVDVSKAYRYKRLSYFIEHLYRMQAQECTTIPDYVINNIAMELRKNGINDTSKIKRDTIRDVLKSLDMTNYYDNINSIIRTLSGQKAPKFQDDLEKKLVCMFMKTLEPFEQNKHLIPSRNNYLSYPYVIRKLLKIISYEEKNENILEFEQYFSFLKSRQKMWEQERVWRAICEYNSWPFFRSI